MRTHTLVTALTSAAAFVLSCVAQPAFAAPAPAARECAILPRTEMHIRLVLEPGVPDDLRSEIESTVTAVWRGEGLRVRWMPFVPADAEAPRVDLWLRVVDRPLGPRTRAGEPTLGVVRFIGGLPHHDVLVSWPAVVEWIAADRNRRLGGAFTGALRTAHLELGGYDVLARRALAHAAAHEVGHFVLGVRSHDRGGLMRRDLVPRTVIDLDPRDLRLSNGNRRRLSQRLVRAAACEGTVVAGIANR